MSMTSMMLWLFICGGERFTLWALGTVDISSKKCTRASFDSSDDNDVADR